MEKQELFTWLSKIEAFQIEEAKPLIKAIQEKFSEMEDIEFMINITELRELDILLQSNSSKLQEKIDMLNELDPLSYSTKLKLIDPLIEVRIYSNKLSIDVLDVVRIGLSKKFRVSSSLSGNMIEKIMKKNTADNSKKFNDELSEIHKDELSEEHKGSYFFDLKNKIEIPIPINYIKLGNDGVGKQSLFHTIKEAITSPIFALFPLSFLLLLLVGKTLFNLLPTFFAEHIIYKYLFIGIILLSLVLAIKVFFKKKDELDEMTLQNVLSNFKSSLDKEATDFHDNYKNSISSFLKDSTSKLEGELKVLTTLVNDKPFF